MSSALNAPETGWSRRVLPLIARFGARLSFTIILYVFLEKFLDPRLILVELVVELAIAMRAGIGSTAGSLRPIYAFCLQGVLVLLLLVVNAGAAASRRRENALCEAEQCASGNLASDLQDALADGTGRCPITHQLMRDPVRTCEWSASRPGCHVYEREDIVKWLRIKRTSPWTNLPLEDITLEPCHLTRDLVERLLAAQPVASPPNCYLDRALELAAKCAAAIGSILLSHSLRNIGIDADVVCNLGGTEGGPAMFEWTGTRSLWSRSGCAIHAPAVRPVFELLPGVKPLAFARGHDGQLSSTWRCKCCNQCMPRGGGDLSDTVWRTFVGRTMPVDVIALAGRVWQLVVLTCLVTKIAWPVWQLLDDPDRQVRPHKVNTLVWSPALLRATCFCWALCWFIPNKVWS